METDLGQYEKLDRPGGTRKKRTGVLVAGVTAGVVGLVMGTAGIAGASTSSSPTTISPAVTSHGVRHPLGARPAATGTVRTVGTDTFTLTTRHGTVVTVNVNGTTTYRDRAVTSPTLRNVTVGSHVTVTGTDTSNAITATKVLIGGEQGRLGGPRHSGAWQNNSPSVAPPAAA